jgi:hypothetical protein
VAGSREAVTLPADRYAVVRLSVFEKDAEGRRTERVVCEQDPALAPREIDLPAGKVTGLSLESWRR